MALQIKATKNFCGKEVNFDTAYLKIKKELINIRNSKMIEESFENCNIDLNDIRISKLTKNIISSLKNKKYNSASFYLTTRKLLKR
jgi:hypothetical protein